jgi:hypothetical protein
VTRPAAVRALLAFLALGAAVPGVWAVLAPRGFYDDFPGTGHWVARLPAYSAHLTTDVGAFYLAFALLFAWAAARPERALVVPLCAAWALFSVLHLGWHAAHLDAFGTGDAVAEVASLAIVLAAPAAVIALLRPARGAVV